MTRFHLVTDSSARFGNHRQTQQLPLTMVANTVMINGKSYREDVDLPVEEALRQAGHADHILTIVPPSADDFVAVFSRLAQTHDAIISIHPSRELSSCWENARVAAQQVSGSCEIVVIDSRNICVGQGLLVRLAGQAILNGLVLDDVVKETRSAIDRLYSLYVVDTLDPLYRNGIVTESRMILGTMLGIRPLLSIEEGRLLVTEKVRTRAQAVERMVEFLLEFDQQIEDAVIVQPRPSITEVTRTLQDRLSVEFPGRHFPFTMYGAQMISLIGTTATGVVVLERGMDSAHGQ